MTRKTPKTEDQIKSEQAALDTALDAHFDKKTRKVRPDAVALDIARALAEPLTGFDFDDLLEEQQDELLTAAYAAMDALTKIAESREPLDAMSAVEFPFADNH